MPKLKLPKADINYAKAADQIVGGVYRLATAPGVFVDSVVADFYVATGGPVEVQEEDGSQRAATKAEMNRHFTDKVREFVMAKVKAHREAVASSTALQAARAQFADDIPDVEE